MSKELIIDFVRWLRARGIYLIYVPTLTTTTEEGEIRVIDDFLKEKEQWEQGQ